MNVRPPRVSNNRRLESVYASRPHRLNREFTLPCRVQAQPSYFKAWGMDETTVASLAREIPVVILPRTYRDLSASRRNQVRVLASPHECGRVLELDEPVLIDGVEHVATYKGIGATRFYRDTEAVNPWRSRERHFDTELQRRLMQYPFFDDAGFLFANSAQAELEMHHLRHARGDDVEKIIGLFEIEALPDERGDLRGLRYFRDAGILPENETPQVMIRAMKTNLRLLEIVMADQQCERWAMGSLCNTAVELYRRFTGSTGGLEDYFCWVLEKSMRQQLPLIFDGYQTVADTWQDYLRNISFLGEEVDVGSADFHDYIFRNDLEGHRDSYQDFVAGRIDTAHIGFSNIARRINHALGMQIRSQRANELAAHILEEFMTGFDYEALYAKFRDPKAAREFYTPRQLRFRIFQVLPKEFRPKRSEV